MKGKIKGEKGELDIMKWEGGRRMGFQSVHGYNSKIKRLKLKLDLPVQCEKPKDRSYK